MKARNQKQINRAYLKFFLYLGACILLVAAICISYVYASKTEAELRENYIQVNNQ